MLVSSCYAPCAHLSHIPKGSRTVLACAIADTADASLASDTAIAAVSVDGCALRVFLLSAHSIVKPVFVSLPWQAPLLVLVLLRFAVGGSTALGPANAALLTALTISAISVCADRAAFGAATGAYLSMLPSLMRLHRPAQFGVAVNL